MIIGGKEYYSDFFSFTTKAPSSSTITPTVSVSFANNTSKYTVGETTATVARTISVSGASVSSVTKVGAVLYNSSGSQLTSKSETPVPKDGVINAWHTIGSGQELNYALTAGTTYKYRFFVTISGENYYSDYFTTNAPTSAISVSFADYSKASVGTTNAVLAKTISVSGASISSVAKVGIELYNNSNTKLASKSETPVPKNGVINAWYDVNRELGYTLSSNTTYKYRFFVIISGTNYYSTYFSFTTGADSVSISLTINSAKHSIGSTTATLANTMSITGAGTNTTITYMRDGLRDRGLLCSCGGSAYDRGTIWLYNTWFSNPDLYEPFGWVATSYSEADDMANVGYLTIGVASGHVFIVHPNSASGVYISQAGGTNMDNKPIPSGYTSYSFFYNKGL